MQISNEILIWRGKKNQVSASQSIEHVELCVCYLYGTDTDNARQNNSRQYNLTCLYYQNHKRHQHFDIHIYVEMRHSMVINWNRSMKIVKHEHKYRKIPKQIFVFYGSKMCECKCVSYVVHWVYQGGQDSVMMLSIFLTLSCQSSSDHFKRSYILILYLFCW